jgi:hypothetical protein
LLVAGDVELAEVVGETVGDVETLVSEVAGETGFVVGATGTLLGALPVTGAVPVPEVVGSVGAGLDPPVPQLAVMRAPRTQATVNLYSGLYFMTPLRFVDVVSFDSKCVDC